MPGNEKIDSLPVFGFEKVTVIPAEGMIVTFFHKSVFSPFGAQNRYEPSPAPGNYRANVKNKNGNFKGLQLVTQK
ncbi:MAG: hypothetical protein KAW01_06005 [Deltaproteobacteria bacterium]|nr:hypothetical protein [Deltaproteobacteria bacterium]